jgi:hypothetical protein
MAARVNQHTAPATVPKIVAGFAPRQREWYHRLLADAAPQLGYDLDADVA